MGEEAWFEDRYPNLLNDRKDWFINVTSSWLRANWGQTTFDEKKFGAPLRQNIYSRGKRRNDDQFQKQGDTPQSFHEADKALGSFAIDVETPIKINYSSITKTGRKFDKFQFETVMYVEDVLGLQPHDPIHNRGSGWMFPSRKVRRAEWTIQGSGTTYLVKPGDTLGEIAKSAYGDPMKWKEIKKENYIKDENKIVVGTRLIIP